MIYGCFYYKKNLTLGRVLVAKGIVVIVVNLFLNTLWLSMLGGKAFMALLPPRLLKNIIMWPIDSLVFFALAKTLEKAGVFRPFRSGIAVSKAAK